MTLTIACDKVYFIYLFFQLRWDLCYDYIEIIDRLISAGLCLNLWSFEGSAMVSRDLAVSAIPN